MFRVGRFSGALLLGMQETNRYTDGSGRKLDGAEIPSDLYIEPLNDKRRQNAYPARYGDWQPVVAGKPNAYRGNVVVNGGGVIGSAAASLFALRGWHVTVVEEKKPSAIESKDQKQKKAREKAKEWGVDPEAEAEKAEKAAAAEGNTNGTSSSSSSSSTPIATPSFEVGLMTKRGMDVLHSCGLRHKDIRSVGTKVTGVLDHPTSSVNSLMTYGLAELHNFAVNNVAVDLGALRQRMHSLLYNIPFKNGKIFFEHKAVAHLPEQKILVVKPLALDRVADGKQDIANTEEKGVVVGGIRFEEFVEGIDYDLLIGADGHSSTIRNLIMDEEDLAQSSERNFAVSWFVVEDSNLDPSLVHRWLHRCEQAEDNPLKELPCVFAFPKGDNGHFAVMSFLPMSVQDYYFGKGKEDETVEQRLQKDFIENWCPELGGRVMQGAYQKPKPAPGIYLKNLYNHKNMFPNTMLIGDAAHSCHPFLLQGLSCALEDVAYCLNIMDYRERSSYDNIRQFSSERGATSDRLRNITDRALYYHTRKHRRPDLRFRNFYAHFMHIFCPRQINEQYQGLSNYRYPRSIESMLNGRGYTSYDEIDAAQTRANRFYCMTRLYT